MSGAYYRATPDRAGWALLTGALGGGGAIALAQVAGGERDPLALAATVAGGALLAAAAIAAIGGPAWWLCQRRGRRGPVAAALTGGLVGFVAMLMVGTAGFGIGLPPTDALTLAFRWTSAAAVAGFAGVAGAGVATAMWLVGYRRVREPLRDE